MIDGIENNNSLMEKLDLLVKKQRQLVAFAYEAIRNSKPPPAKIDPKLSQERREIPKGSLMNVWKQDPSVKRIGIRKVHLAHNVQSGPSDDCIQVVKQINADNVDDKIDQIPSPDENGDFLIDFKANPFQFDCANVYAICRQVVDMYVRDLKIDWKWQWDVGAPPGAPRTPLRIICHAGEKPNAAYIRGKKALKFYYYTNNGETTYLCRSLDIVAHEAGHAVLDALKPSLYSIRNGQAGALHEAFADLTAMFVTLENLDMCEDIIVETKCNLRQAHYLTAIAEQFAGALGGNAGPKGSEGEDETAEESEDQIGMRNINNDIVGSRCPNDVHSLASIFSGFVFDFLVDVFTWERDPDLLDDAESLHRVGRIVRRILLLALYNSGQTPDFTEIANAMIKAVETISADDPADIPEYQRYLLYARDRRELNKAGGL